MFLSTPPSRVATNFVTLDSFNALVSIHATLAGGDGVPSMRILDFTVSIHATLAGGDPIADFLHAVAVVFLSTPPSRVATVIFNYSTGIAQGFYPRHPRGWRPSIDWSCDFLYYVSIHATLAGGDHVRPLRMLTLALFLSTPPSRVAT